MDAAIKSILLKFDEVGSYEFPSHCSNGVDDNDVQELKQRLEQLFGLPFELDNFIQDASFHCDLVIPKELVIIHKTYVLYSIRISNFGGLTTIGNEEYYSPETVTTIIDAVLECGLVFISSNDLQEKYDGSFDGFKKILGPNATPDWWTRYFDYL